MKMANLLSLEEAADGASSESFVSDDDATDGTADSSEDNVEGELDIDGASSESFVSEDDATDGFIDESEEDNVEGALDVECALDIDGASEEQL
jgi:hypothetical protein